jgi:hypothetical protein
MGLRNFFLKYNSHIIILLIATFIWIHVKTELGYEQVVPVNIEPINLNPEYVIINDYTKTVPIRFEGKGKNLIALRNTDVTLQVDFNQTSEKKVNAILYLKNVKIPTHVGEVTPIEFVEKDTINFFLNPLMYKFIPVEHQITIKPRAGFTMIGDIKLTPSEISVSGPEDKINTSDIIRTEQIMLDDVTVDVVHWAKLINTFPEGVTLNSNEVEYSADIQQIIDETIEYIPVEVINIPKNLKVTALPSTLSLKVSGGIDIINELKKEEISAYIDFKNYDAQRKNSLPAIINTPDYVTFSQVTPEVFELKISQLQ